MLSASFVVLALGQTKPAAPALVPLTANMVVRKATAFKAGTYRIPTPESLAKPAIVIEGNGITVDLKGVILEGTPQSADPDKRMGLGIEVRGKNVTLKNARVRGYKVGLIARNVQGLKIIDSDFSYNWKPRLLSTLDTEDGADWMSYHRNEKDQWLQYGAGVYLRGCNAFEVKNTKIRGGGNGLMIMECNKGLIWNSDFSFLSAIGLGMYLSSDNRIMHNNIDWCVRGYSHGKWNRGQDSAGILIYEQSHRNIFAYNSVTHGGDGFFLWAGQSTMDTGKGGCNDNLLYANDFSHAPTNGIEATFSRNNFVNNKVLECWHGVWGGFSYETKIVGNIFGHNAEAIALEHGQDNTFEGNVFNRDLNALNIWMNPTVDPNWGYGKARDTRSQNYKVSENVFRDISGTTVNLRDTAKFSFTGNLLERNTKPLVQQGKNPDLLFTGNTATGAGGAGMPEGNIATKDLAKALPPTMQGSGNVIIGLDPKNSDYIKRFDVLWFPWPNTSLPRPGSDAVARASVNAGEVSREYAPKPLKGGIDPFLKEGTLRGRRFILVDNWGPYDFQSPILWPRQWMEDGSLPTGDRAGEQRFEILGPKGKWKLIEKTGLSAVSATSGTVPGSITVTATKGQPGLTKLTLEYVGGQTTDVKGIVTPAGKPVRFTYEKFVAPIEWDVKFFPWNADNDPRTKVDAFAQLIKGTPIVTKKTGELNYAGWGFEKGVPNNNFATVAEGSFTIPAGTYTLDFTSDDGLRVWLDGKPIVEDAWKYQGPTLYSRKVKLGGKHSLRVEHFQIDGYAALKFAIRPAR